MPYSEAYADVFAAPDNISHADRDDSHILRKKLTHGVNQIADKRPQPGLKHGKRWFKINLIWLKNLLFIN